MLYNFAQWKGAKKKMEIILMVFLEKDPIQGSFVILVQKWYVIITFWICSQVFLILQNKRGQGLHENFISFFAKKFHLVKFAIFRSFFYCLIGCGQNWARPLLLMDVYTVRIWFLSWLLLDLKTWLGFIIRILMALWHSVITACLEKSGC